MIHIIKIFNIFAPSFNNDYLMNRYKVHYLVKCKSTVFFILSVICIASTQNKTDHLFSFTSAEFVVDVLPGNDIFYRHPIRKGISIYNLAEVFQLKADKIYAINKLNPTQPINDGRIVKIPFQQNLITQDKGKLSGKKTFVPVFYTAKKGDTAFKVCHLYFDLELKDLLTINGKKESSINLGEKLLIGWYMLPEIKKPSDKTRIKDTQIKKTDPTSAVAEELKKQNIVTFIPDTLVYDKVNPTVKYYISDVIGWWDKSSQASDGYFALHNEAKPGTNIDIYNPMQKSHVRAKVIGKIPSDTHKEEVQIILSNNVVKDLGILDARYTVNIKFEK